MNAYEDLPGWSGNPKTDAPYGIIANVVETDRLFRTGAKAWLSSGWGGNGWERFKWIAMTRGGKIIEKWSPIHRFGNFRAAWVPDHLQDRVYAMRGTKEQMQIRASELSNFADEFRLKHPNRREIRVKSISSSQMCSTLMIAKLIDPKNQRWREIESAPKDGRTITVKRVFDGRVIYEGPAEWRTVHFAALPPDPLGRPPQSIESAYDATGWMYPASIMNKRVPEPTHWLDNTESVPPQKAPGA